MIMTEQQQHLSNLLTQRNEILKDIETLQTKINSAKELGLKVQGAIEYLEQVGVKLDDDNTEETADKLLETAEGKLEEES